MKIQRSITALFAIYMVCLLAGCGQNLQTDNVPDCPSPATISSETATYIARGDLFLDYDLRHYDMSVTEDQEAWIVSFASRCRNCEGGDPSVTISKIDGRILHEDTPK